MPANNGSHITFVLSTEGYKRFTSCLTPTVQTTRAHHSMVCIAWTVRPSARSRKCDRLTAFTKEEINLSGEGGLGLKSTGQSKDHLSASNISISGWLLTGNIALDRFPADRLAVVARFQFSFAPSVTHLVRRSISSAQLRRRFGGMCPFSSSGT